MRRRGEEALLDDLRAQAPAVAVDRPAPAAPDRHGRALQAQLAAQLREGRVGRPGIDDLGLVVQVVAHQRQHAARERRQHEGADAVLVRPLLDEEAVGVPGEEARRVARVAAEQLEPGAGGVEGLARQAQLGGLVQRVQPDLGGAHRDHQPEPLGRPVAEPEELGDVAPPALGDPLAPHEAGHDAVREGRAALAQGGLAHLLQERGLGGDDHAVEARPGAREQLQGHLHVDRGGRDGGQAGGDRDPHRQAVEQERGGILAPAQGAQRLVEGALLGPALGARGDADREEAGLPARREQLRGVGHVPAVEPEVDVVAEDRALVRIGHLGDARHRAVVHPQVLEVGPVAPRGEGGAPEAAQGGPLVRVERGAGSAHGTRLRCR